MIRMPPVPAEPEAASPSRVSDDDGSVGSPYYAATPLSAGDDSERYIQEALASLNLPHMPEKIADDDDDQKPSACSTDQQYLPSITVLVCADIDLKSASALAEYTLQQKNKVFDATAIDLIIVAGPCTRDTDLLHYYNSGSNSNSGKRRRLENKSKRKCHDGSSNTTSVPFVRSSREQSSALEGLMTAALSQLESIVCRVVYCPGYSDPLTTIVVGNNNNNNNNDDDDNHYSLKRLTPNSRNIHRNWLPLVPGLGCTALFYLDGCTTDQLTQLSEATSSPPRAADADATAAATAYIPEDDDDDSDASDEEEDNSMAILSEQLSRLQLSSSGYCSTLSKLLQLAPKPEHPAVRGAHRGQSILVTHYVDSQSLLLQREDSLTEDSNHHGDAYKADDDYDGSDATNGKATTLPWPSDHDAFLESDIAQQHLCLEIASGYAASHRPAWIHGNNRTTPQTKGPVLLPGSLRERGEFCILRISLVEQQQQGCNESTASSSRRFQWQVQSVDFHRLNSFC